MVHAFLGDDHFLWARFDVQYLDMECERGCGQGKRRRRCWRGNGRRGGNGNQPQRDMFDKITNYLNRELAGTEVSFWYM